MAKKHWSGKHWSGRAENSRQASHLFKWGEAGLMVELRLIVYEGSVIRSRSQFSKFCRPSDTFRVFATDRLPTLKQFGLVQCAENDKLLGLFDLYQSSIMVALYHAFIETGTKNKIDAVTH